MSRRENDLAFVIGFALATRQMQCELDLVRHQIAADWASLRQELAETRAELDVALNEIAALLRLRLAR
jgi:hypothetical protein